MLCFFYFFYTKYGYFGLTGHNKLWYYIKYEGLYIGSVWLEKNNADDFAVLGVFIANENYCGNGIGLIAVQTILKNIKFLGVNKVVLRVREDNKRAIKCYRKAGFVESRQYVKDNGINAVEMIYNK